MPDKPSPIAPKAVFAGSLVGDWRVSLVDAKAIQVAIGRPLFAAFLKCFVGVDRVMSLEQMLELNQHHLERDSPAHDRNLRVLVFLMAGTLYELGEALQELCSARVTERMADKNEWTPINAIRKQWHTNPLMSKFRNQLAHHLGELEAYGKGLDATLGADTQMILSRGRGQTRYADESPAAWEVLFRGVEISNAEFQQGIVLTRETHLRIP